MIKMLLIIILLVAVTPTPILPEDNPLCGSPWFLMSYSESHPLCGGGERYLFACLQQDPRKPFIYQSICLSSIFEDRRMYIYLPLMVKDG